MEKSWYNPAQLEALKRRMGERKWLFTWLPPGQIKATLYRPPDGKAKPKPKPSG